MSALFDALNGKTETAKSFSLDYGGARIKIEVQEGGSSRVTIDGESAIIQFNPMESFENRMRFLRFVDDAVPSQFSKFVASEWAASALVSFVSLDRFAGGAGFHVCLKPPLVAKQLCDMRFIAFWYKAGESVPFLGDVSAFVRDTMPKLFFNAECN